MKRVLKNSIKFFFCILLVVIIIINNNSTFVLANSISTISEAKKNSIGEIGGYLSQNVKMIHNLYDERRFVSSDPNYTGGPGYALEQAMNFHDILRGYKSKVVGGNNKPDGEDRVIINKKGEHILIQDKFRVDKAATVREMFNADGSLRYVDQVTGKPMMYEVPSDQYEYVLANLKDRIANNRVPGITDPNQAESIVRKSAYTTDQLINITKAGNFDSLLYDAQHGIIYAGGAMGISFVLDYLACRMNGYTNEDAIKTSSLCAINTGIPVFFTYTISSQLARTSILGLTDSAAKTIVNSLSDDIVKKLANMYGIDIFADGAAKAALRKELNEKVTKAISRQLLTSAVLIVVLEVPDILDILNNRISPQQLLKNLTVTVATVAGGTGGMIAGGAIGGTIGGTVGGIVGSVLPGLGTVAGASSGGAIGGKVGGFLGGIGGSIGARSLSEAALNNLYKGDADKMYAILTDVYRKGCVDYILDEKEADEVAKSLSNELNTDKLKDMYSSKDRVKFAEDLLEPIFLAVAKNRTRIPAISEEEVRKEMLQLSRGYIFVH